MSKIYKFDSTTSPVTVSEWEHGRWETEMLDQNETLVANTDGTFTMTEVCKGKVKSVVYAVAGQTPDGTNYYAPVSMTTAPGSTDAMVATAVVMSSTADDDQDGDGHHDDHIKGGRGKDKKHGWAGNDSFDGGEGDDDLYGDAGDDDLLGGAGDDILHGGEGLDHVEGDHGRDRLFGDAGDDDLDGGLGKDILQGGAGDDLLSGGADADSLSGGDGDDTLTDDAGNDVMDGGAGDDLIMAGAGAGNDTFSGVAGTDTVNYSTAVAGIVADLGKGVAVSLALDAGIGRDRLATIENIEGSDFDDRLIGSGGANELNGGDGNDTIDGGCGVDQLTGSVGDDVFRFAKVKESGLGSGADTITDFTTGDLIDLSAMDAKAGLTRNDTFTFSATAPAIDAGNGVLWFDTDSQTLFGSTDKDADAEFSIVLLGVTSLSASDIVL